MAKTWKLLILAIALSVADPALAQEFDLARIGSVEQPRTMEVLLISVASARVGAVARRPSRRNPDAPPPERTGRTWTADASLGVVSDFRRGGLSSSDGRPAVQGEALIEHRSGFFAAAFASSTAPHLGAGFETDISVGKVIDFKRAELSLAAMAYIFPGLRNSSYLELQSEIALPIGPVRPSLGLAYTPKQAHVPKQNLYLGVGAEFPVKIKGVLLQGSFGYENGAFGRHKLDWSVGALYRIGSVELGAAYVDAARTSHAPHSGSTLLLSLRTFV